MVAQSTIAVKKLRKIIFSIAIYNNGYWLEVAINFADMIYTS